jgi:hypothetical protein
VGQTRREAANQKGFQQFSGRAEACFQSSQSLCFVLALAKEEKEGPQRTESSHDKALQGVV